MQFVVVRDSSGLLQATLERSDAHADLNATISALTRESAVEVTGTVVADPRVKLGGVEIQIASLRVVSAADPVLPIDLGRSTATALDKRLDWRFLDLRRPENLLIWQAGTTAEMAMREFWTREGFVELHSPKLMGTPSESGAELFSLEYFGQTAYLAQSPQFYKQMAMATVSTACSR